MKITVSRLRSDDDILEIRAVMRGTVIVSRINYTHLARIRQTLAMIDRVRADGIRTGLFELALSPASVSHDFLQRAAVSDIAEMPTSASGVIRNDGFVTDLFRPGVGAPGFC